MKRSYLVIFFLVMGVSLFARGALGWTLRSIVSLTSSCKLTYRSISFDQNGISLHNPMFLDLGSNGSSRFHLHAELLWIGWDQGIVWYAEAPHVTLSPDVLLGGKGSFVIPFRGEAVRGILDWKGGVLPAAYFDYQNDGEAHLQLCMDPITFSWKGLRCKEGRAEIDWSKKKWKGVISNLVMEGEEETRLDIDQAIAHFEEETLGNWEWQGKGISSLGPILCKGKGTFADQLYNGLFQLGNLEAKIETNRLDWRQFSPVEGQFLQKLLSPVFPLLNKVQWESGTVSGSAEWKDSSFFLKELVATEISFQEIGFKSLKKDATGLHIDGGWIGEISNSWAGFLDPQGNQFRVTGNLLGHASCVEGVRLEGTDFELRGNLGLIQDFTSRLHLSIDQIQFETLKGKILIPQLKESFEVWAPILSWNQGQVYFDVRLEKHLGEWFRLVGVEKKGEIVLDDQKSHFLGTPFVSDALRHVNGIPHQGSLQIDLPANKVSLALSAIQGVNPDWIQGDAQLALSFNQQGFQFTFKGPEIPLPYWNVPLAGELLYQSNAFLFHVNQSMIVQDEQGNIVVQKWPIALSSVHPSLSGEALANGVISFGHDGMEGDWKISFSNFACHGKGIELHGPLQIFYSSREGILFKGIEGTVQTDEGPIFAKANVVQIPPPFDLLRIEKGHLHCPIAYLQLPLLKEGFIDCWGDFETDWNGANFRGIVTEATGPLRIENLEFEKTYGFLSAKGRCIAASGPFDCALLMDPTHTGRLFLSEPEQERSPLTIEATFYPKLQIRSAIGSFAGIDAYFHAPSSESRLIGTAQVNFAHLASWVPSEIRKAFVDLEMGRGHILKGEVAAPGFDWTEATFKGIWTGKNCELFGYELRSLLASASFNQHHVHIEQLSIIDSAGAGNVAQILIQEEPDGPWTLSIPKIKLIDLRPSLLHARGEPAGPLTPLLVRHLELGPITGLAADGTTYRGNGTLDFINSFKRESSILDWPSRFFGWIIGLDLDLMTPVRGTLDFELRNGYYWLTHLKEAFSEHDRSQFFLVEDPPPRMDLDGNLEIFIKMKQHVLFKITDAFVISIDGKLNDPKIRLQKKSRFS